MKGRVLFVSSSNALENPYLSPLAANTTWLPGALNERGFEVAEARAADWDEVRRLALSYRPDLVHVHGVAAGSSRIDGIPVLATDYALTKPRAPFVSLSWAEAARWDTRPAAIIPPALDTTTIPPTREAGDHLAMAFDGRDEHALAAAIAIATDSERPLVVFTEMDKTTAICRSALRAGEEARWLRVVKPARHELPEEILGGAAYLALSRGSVDMGAVAAMSAGVPVITLARAPSAELIVGGESGFICPTADDAARALERLSQLSPALARSRARVLFDGATAAAAYETIYRAVASGRVPAYVHPELGREASGAPFDTGRRSDIASTSGSH